MQMRREQIRRWLATAVTTLVMLGVATLVAQQGPRELVERARLLEENSRTIDRAIAIYERVVAESAGDRALAASAQLRIALLKERQGKAEARAAFATVVTRYPEQRGVVAEARTRLGTARAVARTTDLVPRLIRNDRSFPSAISPDGRHALVVTDETPSRLTLQDIGTGQMVTLVQSSDTAWARTPVFSPDGRQVAYSWVELDRPRGSGPPVPNATTALRIIDAVAGAAPRTIVGPSVGYFALSPAGWSPDGTAVLVHRATRAKWDSPMTTSALAWVNVGSGAIRPIKDLEPWRDIGGAGGNFGFNGVSLSPDGRTVAYSARVREGSTERAIHAVDARGERDSVIVSVAGTNTQPIWTPDGTHILFINTRSGRRGLWAVPVRDGVASGEPRTVTADFGGHLLDMPRTGELFHVLPADDGGFWEFVAERGASGARIAQAFPGQGARWSRGNRLAFIRPGAEGNDFIVRTAATGEERLHQHAGLSNVSPRWFSDDSAVILFVEAVGDNGTLGGAFSKLDITSGTFTRLFARHAATHERSFSTALSPDNKTLYLAVRAADKAPWTGIVGVDLATGVERNVVTFPTPLSGRSQPGLALSPDGATLAVQTWADETSQDGRLMTVRLDGTAFHELHGPFPGGGWSDRLSWTPDGESILFVRQAARGPAGSWQVMSVAAGGGAAVPDGLDSSNLTSAVSMPRVETGNVSNVDLSADGSRLVFSSRTIPTYDFRVLDNVLGVLTP